MLIPSQSNMTSYFRYDGSLTTPACEESVVWTMFENTIPLSRQQVLYRITFDIILYLTYVTFILDIIPVQSFNYLQSGN